jgi:hypothetical protein
MRFPLDTTVVAWRILFQLSAVSFFLTQLSPFCSLPLIFTLHRFSVRTVFGRLLKVDEEDKSQPYRDKKSGLCKVSADDEPGLIVNAVNDKSVQVDAKLVLLLCAWDGLAHDLCVRVGRRATEFLLLTTVIEDASVRLLDSVPSFYNPPHCECSCTLLCLYLCCGIDVRLICTHRAATTGTPTRRPARRSCSRTSSRR